MALACCCAAMFGQTVTSSMVGSVVDPADAAVAGVPVTLTDTGTGAVRHVITDNQGTFRFVNLDPGIYNVMSPHPGSRVKHRPASS